MSTALRQLTVLFVLLSAIVGVVYPLVVTAIGQVLFAREVSGSLVKEGGKTVGSALISQSFQEPKYFWGRLSATNPMPNNAGASSGSNFGPTNPALLSAARMRVDALKAADPANGAPVPIDLVTASASGLDPHISPAAALYQVGRVAAARGIDPNTLRLDVVAAVEPPQWGILGEPRVNVLLLNLALDHRR